MSRSLTKFGMGAFGDYAYLGPSRIVVRGKDTTTAVGLLFLLKGLPRLLFLGMFELLFSFPVLTFEGLEGPSLSFLVCFGIVLVGNQMRRYHKVFDLFEFLLFFWILLRLS